MNEEKKNNRIIVAAVLILAVLAVAGYAIAGNNRKETVNGYYVHEFDGETTEDPVLPEDAVEDVPEDIELQENEIYIGTEENTETEGTDERILDELMKSGKTSATEIEQEEKKLGLKGKISYYYYNKLNSQQKAVYRSIYKGILNHESGFRVDTTRDTLYDDYCRVMYDHPELFWADISYRYWDYGQYIRLEPVYNRPEEQVKKDREKVNTAVNKIVKEASKEENKYKMALYVYKYLIRSIDYKLDVKDNQNVYSSLVNKVTVCAGYAKATQLLFQKLGIQCIYVCGNTDRGRHAWNILKLGKKYYQIDTCWGDPNYSNFTDEYLKKLPKILRYDYAYFCVDDKSMLKSRKQENNLGLPSCTSKDKSFFIYNKRYFSKYDDKVKNSIKKNIKAGKNYWQGQMAN